MKKFLSLTLAAFAFSVVANAQYRKSWDFTNWSDETVANVKADAAAWSFDEKGDGSSNLQENNCYWQVTVVEGTITANGTPIKELEGLNFTNTRDRSLALAFNYPETSIGTYHGAKYLWLGSKEINYFTIPGVAAGATIKIGVESHKNSDARGIQLFIGSETGTMLLAPDGSEVAVPTTYQDQVWTVPAAPADAANADGTYNIVIRNTNGCHLYYITVEEAGSAAYADGLLVKNESGLIVCKPAAELNNNEYDQNKEDSNEEAATNSYWYMPAGTLFYEDADIKISAAVQSTICPQSWNAEVNNYGADAYVNLGCGGYFKSGESPMTEDNAKSEIWDPAVLVKGNQGTLLIEAKKSGKYTATVHHSKGNRLIGMYLIYNDSEIEATEKPGKFIATADNISMGADGATKGAPAEWSCDLEAGRSYYLIAGDNNIAVFTQKFETGTNGIEGVVVKETTCNKIYSIDGRFVGTEKSSLKSGLYIMGGKKVVVK